MSTSSNERRTALYAGLNRAVRLFIAGSSMYSQRVAEKLGRKLGAVAKEKQERFVRERGHPAAHRSRTVQSPRAPGPDPFPSPSPSPGSV